MQGNASGNSFFTPFTTSVEGIPLPDRFNFPFYYEPHPLALLAAKELQEYLLTQTDWQHNFGLEPGMEGLVIGKMFGVLVVRNSSGTLGYLSAFSGKLAGGNHHPRFVPPVFDILTEDGFFRKGEEIVSSINRRIEELESGPELLELRTALQQQQTELARELEKHKVRMKENKLLRDQRRAQGPSLSAEEQLRLTEILARESLQDKFVLKDIARHWTYRIETTQHALEEREAVIEQLKEERRIRSAALQQQLFDHYSFLNIRGENRSLWSIFQGTSEGRPPAGAGECAAPKLLQYAFTHELYPVCMAEFWWGASPKSEVRVHGHYYPACRGKCEPILGHMLEGMSVDPNPMLANPAEGREISIVYEDDFLAIVNKPEEFLSVPGKAIRDSVYERMRIRYPEAEGPLLVHRLDMSTSGLIIVAKTKEAHKHLQNQFIRRTVQKRYVALLDGIVAGEKGVIDLPLRVDLDNRPQQLVCHEHGKPAQTRWEVAERIGNKTLVYFYPVTGRTHQLRVHAAHQAGLNTPIVGDDLYGTRANRLHLHAERITFVHPATGSKKTIRVAASFTHND